MTWDEVVGLLRGTPPAHLATTTPDGAPHVAKVMLGIDGDHLWVATRRTSGKARNLRHNRAIAAMVEGNNAETYVWGTAETLDDPEEVARVWSGGVFPMDLGGFFGSPDNPDLQLVRIRPHRVVAMVAGPNGPVRRVWTATA